MVNKTNIETLFALKNGINLLEQKQNKTEKENLTLRNLKRIIDVETTKSVFCPELKINIANLMRCMFCPYGHMTECHYPHDCDSEYCNHYKEEEV